MTRMQVGVAGRMLGLALLLLLLVPMVALLLSATSHTLGAGVSHPLFWPALSLSLRTTLCSLLVMVLTGTPLAWWLATSPSRAAGVVGALVQLPIVIPPAVTGVGLLLAFGRQGIFGPLLSGVGLQLAFTEAAVVFAQVVVSAPFFVRAAEGAFRRVDADALTVARTLGASRVEAFIRVALPLAAPGLWVGASLGWARALGEFGATLLFAGNLGGRTQTMPLAILTALESDLQVAVALSLVLAAMGVLALLALRAAPALWGHEGGR